MKHKLQTERMITWPQSFLFSQLLPRRCWTALPDRGSKWVMDDIRVDDLRYSMSYFLFFCFIFSSLWEVLADCILGDSSKGVFLCKHADIHLKAAARKGQQNCWLFMFLVSFFLFSYCWFVLMQFMGTLGSLKWKPPQSVLLMMWKLLPHDWQTQNHVNWIVGLV